MPNLSKEEIEKIHQEVIKMGFDKPKPTPYESELVKQFNEMTADGVPINVPMLRDFFREVVSHIVALEEDVARLNRNTMQHWPIG